METKQAVPFIWCHSLFFCSELTIHYQTAASSSMVQMQTACSTISGLRDCVILGDIGLADYVSTCGQTLWQNSKLDKNGIIWHFDSMPGIAICTSRTTFDIQFNNHHSLHNKLCWYKNTVVILKLFELSHSHILLKPCEPMLDLQNCWLSAQSDQANTIHQLHNLHVENKQILQLKNSAEPDMKVQRSNWTCFHTVWQGLKPSKPYDPACVKSSLEESPFMEIII